MVIGIIGRQVANYGIRQVGRYLTQLHKYDVSIHKGLYGASGGRGVRHGRDAGIFISQYRQGDDLDTTQESPKYSSRKKPQAYSRCGNQYGYKRNQYNTRNRGCPKPRPRKYNGSRGRSYS